MLPYAGVHHLLFDYLKNESALVVTSANVSGAPIIHNNRDALNNLSSFVDYFLIHDRDIVNRCDDSVVQVSCDDQVTFVRRSRGYVPAPVRLQQKSTRCVIGLGAELNVAACVIVDDKAFLSQHVGNIDTLENYLFLKGSINHLLRITTAKPQLVVCDLHPSLNTTRLAANMAEEIQE
jgi:hydrogenase maturation protein HypF